MKDNNFYSKRRLNVCLNATEQVIRNNGFQSPMLTLEKMVHAFFDTTIFPIQEIIVNPISRDISIFVQGGERIFQTEVKQNFVDLLYPREKDKREQLPGQMTIEEMYEKDDWFFEERDR